jgi:hypothetical protein
VVTGSMVGIALVEAVERAMNVANDAHEDPSDPWYVATCSDGVMTGPCSKFWAGAALLGAAEAGRWSPVHI